MFFLEVLMFYSPSLTCLKSQEVNKNKRGIRTLKTLYRMFENVISESGIRYIRVIWDLLKREPIGTFLRPGIFVLVF